MRRLTRRQRLAAIVLAGVAVLFLGLDLVGGSLRTAHGGVRGTLGALYRGTDGVLGPVRDFAAGLPHAGTAQHRIAELEQTDRALRAQLRARAADRATVAMLHRLQLAADGAGRPVLPARVLALAPAQGFDWTLTLDVGSADGVRDGQTVTDGLGLVGRILHADRSTATVLMAVDPGSGVGVRDERTGQLGVATGDGTAGFVLRPLDPTAQVQVGDRVETGPAGSSSYVPGLAVGTVTAVRTSADGTTTARLAPAASPTRVDLVGVVTTGQGPAGAIAGRAPLQPAAVPGAGR